MDTCKAEDGNSLSFTVKLMESDSYIDRFRAEYYQTKIRYEKLNKMCVRMEAGTLDFKPACSVELLKRQKDAMENYLYVLEIRAEKEGIEL